MSIQEIHAVIVYGMEEVQRAYDRRLESAIEVNQMGTSEEAARIVRILKSIQQEARRDAQMLISAAKGD